MAEFREQSARPKLLPSLVVRDSRHPNDKTLKCLLAVLSGFTVLKLTKASSAAASKGSVKTAKTMPE